MFLTCPHCQFSKEVDETKLPPKVNKVTCPRCRESFRLQRPATSKIEHVVVGDPIVSPLDVAANAVRTAETKQLPKAGFWIRFVAAMIDGLIVLALQGILGGVLYLAGAFNGSADEMLGILVQLFTYLLGFVYYIFFAGYCGQTPGKMAVRIKIIRCDGSPLTYSRAAFRELPAKFLSGIIFGIGYLMAAFDEQKQSLHDRMADTYVIKL